ncbi:MAG TPA: universal stress protein, partial [Candidatus Binataceae bacterium]|nr:universal stress protein [Candidatus Binataceae bacterium]
PYRKILCPVDFDDNSMCALETAASMAREHDGTIFVLHVVPMLIPPTGMPIYVDLYKGQEQTAKEKLQEVARRRLAGLKYDLITRIGEPAQEILRAQRRVDADLLIMATHGRRGFSRFFLGSVAELVLREAPCPVLTVKSTPAKKNVVSTWMTHNPVTASSDEKLSSVQQKMHEGGFRCVPIIKQGLVVGIVTDRDIRQHYGFLENTEADKAMTEGLITIRPDTDIDDAARILRERKIGALPVVDGEGTLVGVITTTDVLHALAGEEPQESKA